MAFITSAVWVWLFLLLQVASATGDLEAVRLTPLYSVDDQHSVKATVKQFDTPPTTAAENRVQRLGQHLKAVIEEQGGHPPFGYRSRAKALQRKTDSRRRGNAAEQALTRAEAKLNIRYRPLAGTPRQIKMQAVTTARGVVKKLRKALKSIRAGRQRDEGTARSFLRERRGLLRLSNPDQELDLKRYWTDDLGRAHLRYTQMYKGIPVWPAELNVHLDADGNVDLLNGAHVPTPRKWVHKPVLTSARAEAIAAAFVADGNLAPKIESKLIVDAPGNKASRLSWKVNVRVDPTSDWVVIVDALNGNVLSAFNQVNTTAAIGSGFDLQNQLRHLNVWNENNAYYLIDTSKSMYQYGSNPPGLQETNGAIFVLDLQNKDLPQQGGTFSASYVVSPYANSGWLKDGVSLSYNLSQTYDYFEEVHNRNSIDGMGGNIIGLVRTGQNFNNAFWTSEYNAVFFGDAKPYAAALDIVAHEITHGITSFSCNLVYRDQPGALNEAFSDIFGEMVEARTGGTTDWMNGTVFNDNTGRSLKDPSSVEIIPGRGFYYPSKMGAFYYRGSPLLQLLRDEDYGGVHINMTIITHAFYLLAEGLNDAIGIDKAAKIFYRAQNVHLVANSQFIDMRLACIQSAEELYGANSHEVQKVIDAFDRVEIVDDQPTPDPDPTPPVTGKDSYIFVSYDSVNSDYYLARRETSKNDGTEGGRLSTYPVKQARPSISGDGEYAFFIDSFDEGCFIATDGSEVEECLNEGYPMHSVAMSPDQKLYGFVMLDDNGNPQDKIVVIDVRPGGGTKEYDLAAPGTEGYVVETVLHADSMDFTSDNRYLIYDAFNVLKLMDGTVVGAWSIYAIDLLTDQIISLVPPVPGYDIGYPSLSQTTNHLLTYDLYDTATGISTIVAGHLLTGQLAAVSTVDGDYGVPSFNGNDTAIAYTQIDNSQPTGHSIDLQPLAENGFNPEGSSSRDLLNAKFGVIYRRGPFIAPVADISVATTNLRFDNVYQYEAKTQALGIENKGATNLLIQKISITGTDAPMFTVKGGCPGQSLPSGGSCAMQVEFKPSTLGTKAAVIAISSNDPDTPIVKVSVIGTGITNPNDTDGDGVVNDLDDFPDNPNEWLDTDRDGVGNNSDPDDDGDGFSDETEKEKGTDPLDAGDFPGKSAGIAPILNLLLDE